MNLPSFAPQQQGITLSDGLKKVRANLVVPVGPGPTTLRKATFGVFLRATRRLHDAIQRNKFRNNELSHEILLWVIGIFYVLLVLLTDPSEQFFQMLLMMVIRTDEHS